MAEFNPKDREVVYESLVGQMIGIVFDMQAALEDLANKETIILDCEFGCDHEWVFGFVKHWADEIYSLHQQLLVAKSNGTVDQVLFNPVLPIQRKEK